MLYTERVLNALMASPKGCFGHIYRQPANAYRTATLIFATNYKQITHLPSRSTIQQHLTRTLSNNRRTLSPKLREIWLGSGFDSSFTLQNQEDCGSVGRLIRRYVKQLFPEPAFTQTIENKCGRSSKRDRLRLGGLFTTF